MSENERVVVVFLVEEQGSFPRITRSQTCEKRACSSGMKGFLVLSSN